MTPSKSKDFPVICVGGETLDLDLFIELIGLLPVDLGAAIVVIDHLKGLPERLLEALPHDTRMPVEPITEGLRLQPDHIFILERGHDLHVLDGKFRLLPVSKPRGWSDVITIFIRSLVHHWEGPLIAVVLSGLDGDGAAALCELQQAGGLTIVQKVDTAENKDMPTTAIATGCVDFVLTVDGIAKEVVQIVRGLNTQVETT